ncbi:MAG: hypothetical protein ACYDH9_06210 [Limisphaerales bacterium]
MNGRNCPKRIPLEPGGTVVVVGGGPAGAFFAIHLLRKARELQRDVKVFIIERRKQSGKQGPGCFSGNWRGCNYCAGGISPKLNDVLENMGLSIPPEVIQSRLESITIQGYWKNIELEVPAGRKMFSVYRGSRPASRPDRDHSFDSFLLEAALTAGARLIPGEVDAVERSAAGKTLIRYRREGIEDGMEADLAVFAAGVNEESCLASARNPILASLQELIPGFALPPVRRALIFELQAEPDLPANLATTVHFVEYGSKTLRLEMCSLVPKRGFMTVVLIGPSVDAIKNAGENRDIIRQFLELPHVRKLIPIGARLQIVCLCNPSIVIGSARNPFADRVAAVGDLVTARLYKDGILSAEQTAEALADTALRIGIDAASLREGYGPTLQRFRRDNRSAAIVFLLHRIFFSSSVLSRVLYQAVITERKTTAGVDRRLERILWKIASGDDQYADILLSMIHPATLWLVLTGGLLVTLRNYVTELIFGLRWDGFSRFTTGVAKERLETKRLAFSRLIAESHIAVPEKLEFERMYTIKIQAPAARILEQLGRFGETDRGYLRPRWVRIRRLAGLPNEPGCVIQYEVLGRRLCFSLVLEQVVGNHLAVYRVSDGFARGGALIFEIEKFAEGICTLSIYVAFNFTRGRTWATRPFWRLFRLLFPAFVHDVLWNHSLCKLKDLVEAEPETEDEPVACPS